MKNLGITFLIFILFSFNSFTKDNYCDGLEGNIEIITPSKSWTNHLVYNGIQVDYKFEACDNEVIKNQVLVLFRFSNLTNNKVSFSWILEIWRNGTCYNCARIQNPEYSNTLVLNPNEILEGKNNSKENRSLYLFANFIQLSPGMSKQSLTSFKFLNPQTKIIK